MLGHLSVFLAFYFALTRYSFLSSTIQSLAAEIEIQKYQNLNTRKKTIKNTIDLNA